MRNLVAAIFAAIVIVQGMLRSAPQQDTPADIEKAQRLLAIEMDGVHRSLVSHRNELVVGRSGAEREAYARIWFRTRRSHAQIATDMKNPELDREGTIRLLHRARELHRELRRLLGATQPELPVVSVVAPNDDCANALPVGNGSFSADTTMATDDGESSCGFNSGKDVWYVYTAPQGGEIAFETFGSDYDTVLSLHAACPGTTANELACNDDYRGATSRALRTMTSGETVWVRAAGYNRSFGALALNIGPTGSIEGTVLETGALAPIESHRVDLWRSDDRLETTYTDNSGNYAFTSLAPGSYTVEARSQVPYLGELYDDIECHDFDCDRTMGTPVVVDGGVTTSGIDFVLDLGGAILGTVTAARDGSPIENIHVDVFDAGGRWMTSAFTEALGGYLTSSALPTGIYMARTNGRDRFWGELYDELPCPNFCDVTLGSPIVVHENTQTGGIDFTLLESGAISGQVRAAENGFPLSARVGIYDRTGSFAASAYTSSAGTYISNSPLPAGSYTAIAGNVSGYLDEIYSGHYCGQSCDPTLGATILVSDGIITTGIDFSLARSAGILGVTTDAQTGDPVSDVRIRLLDSTGTWFDTAFTDDTGTFFFNEYIEPGTYFAHTYLTTGYFDEGYDDVACESETCVLFFGTPISVSLGELRTGVDFALDKPTATCSLRPHLFLNGLVLSSIYEAYQTITAAGADFGGFPVVLRARDRVSLGNGSRVLAGTSLVVELAPFDDCPLTP